MTFPWHPLKLGDLLKNGGTANAFQSFNEMLDYILKNALGKSIFFKISKMDGCSMIYLPLSRPRKPQPQARSGVFVLPHCMPMSFGQNFLFWASIPKTQNFWFDKL